MFYENCRLIIESSFLKITKFCCAQHKFQAQNINCERCTRECNRLVLCDSLKSMGRSAQKQTNCPSVTHITWKIFNCIFFHRQRGPTWCALRIASIAFVCIRRERFANEWRHCERTRHLDATNYQSLSRNNKAKPWKKNSRQKYRVSYAPSASPRSSR